MKKSILLFFALIATAVMFAQTPDAFNYQAVIRDVSGNVNANANVVVGISILQGSASGTNVFSETHAVTTNAFGLVNLKMGTGTLVSGNFTNINWSTGIYFIEISIDGNVIGTSQLLSVPYALSAKKAETADYNSLTNLPTLNIANWNMSYSWGNHTGLYRPISYVPAWSEITSTPTTISGYGITDAFNGDYNSLSNLPALNITNWNTAYSWGNHTGLYRPISYVPAWNEITSNPFLFDTPEVNELIKFDGTNWVNFSPGYAATNHIHPDATTTVSGFISVVDKAKLDGLQTPDGSETQITAGTNVSVTGNGTTANPYLINAIGSMTHVQRNALTPVAGTMIYNTTTNKPNYYNGTEWMNFDGTTAQIIGDSYQGGILAYILQSGDPGYVAGQTHGLIAAPNDQSAGIQWYNGTYTTTGATATAIGTGNANTNTIVANQGAGSYAAQLCDDLVLGGYSDWYLPSKDELNVLFQNKAAIGNFASTFPYWSSSEYNNFSAWQQNFVNGFQGDYSKNNSTLYVRAIRAF